MPWFFETSWFFFLFSLRVMKFCTDMTESVSWSGAYIQEVADRGGGGGGGGRGSLSLASWSKVEEWRPHPPPPPSIWRPWNFLPWSPSGAPLLMLEWRPVRHADLSFSFLFLSLPFFPLCFFPFPFLFLFFWYPFSVPGAEAPNPPRIRPCQF